MLREVLVPLDCSLLAEAAIPHAAALAGAFGAHLHLLSVVEQSVAGGGATDSVDWRLARDEREAYLERIAERLRAGGLDVGWETAGGTPAERIVELAHARHVDLVVLTSHGRGGFSDFRLAGTASKVVSSADASVLVVRSCRAAAAEPLVYRRILVPVDCSPRSDWAACLAGQIAKAQGAELLLVAVVEAPNLLGSPHQWGEQTKLARRLTELNRQVAERHLRELAKLIDTAPRPVRTRIVEEADVVWALGQVAEEEDCCLVVLSAHGQRKVAGRSYGAVPRGLLDDCERPLLVLQDRCADHAGRHLSAASGERIGVGA